MYIKQVTIHGFKSYRDQTVIETFSPRHNVIVGRNGSGKSNFFAAIRFVLGDAYANMGREERQALLHEGTGNAVMSAYVEVIFDNSDNRFPTGRDEVIIRRTIGLKKDEYSLDRRSVTKSDIANLLESAGFSQSNPYYIVPQGRIGALTNAKNEDRLSLLKEVAGTHVYEEKRQESRKILEETEQKREKIVELLGYIEERLTQLSKERDELKDFQELDKERRSLEYAIFREEETATMDELNDNMTLYNVKNDDVKRLLQKRVLVEDTVRTKESELRQLRLAHDTFHLEKQRLEKEKESLLKIHAKLDVAVTELRMSIANDTQLRQQTAESIVHLRQEIAAKEIELAEFLPRYQAIIAKEQTLMEQLQIHEIQRATLFAKQSRAAQFKTKEERDKWLSTEIPHLEKEIAHARSNHKLTQEDITMLQHKARDIQGSIVEKTNQAEQCRLTLQTMKDQYPQLKQDRDQLMTQRKEAWREEARLDGTERSARDAFDSHDRALASTMDKQTARGLAAVRELTERHSLQGVHGPLYELFQVDDKLQMATEVTAGNSLFHVVVDTDDTAARLMELLATQNLGRVTFMPLNRLQTQTIEYPKVEKTFPLLNVLRYDDRFHRAFQHVFGKTMVCFSLDIAARMAQQHGLHGVTVMGDQMNKSGTVAGGFHDTRRSRLTATEGKRQAHTQLNAAHDAVTAVRQQLTTLDQSITRVLGELQRIETQRTSMHDRLTQLTSVDLPRCHRDMVHTDEQRVIKEQRLVQCTMELRHAEQQMAALRAEVGTPLRATLLPKEQAQLAELSRSMTMLQAEMSSTATVRAQMERDRATMESVLQENLKRRLADTERSGRRDSDDRLHAILESQEDELERVTRDAASSTAALVQLAEKTLGHDALLRQAEQETEETRLECTQVERNMQDIQQQAEKILNRRALLEQKQYECQQRIRELGSIPADAFEKYRDMKTKKLLATLAQVRDALQKYSHVNKKAYEQYVNFTEQRDTLEQRKDELDKSKQAIQTLIHVLDQRKDEAIERTFQQVAQYFTETFRELVATGNASLVMIRRDINDNESGNHGNQEEDEDGVLDDMGSLTMQENGGENRDVRVNKGAKKTLNGGGTSIESYVGISIRVSFHGEHDMHVPIDQLSGGQKTVIALALIFAIQRCDPAPFYLFDEIDASLDAAHRTALANLLASLSTKAQFITTTFRPEMLTHADKFYNVVFANKVSQIDVITKESALQFVEHEATS